MIKESLNILDIGVAIIIIVRYISERKMTEYLTSYKYVLIYNSLDAGSRCEYCVQSSELCGYYHCREWLKIKLSLDYGFFGCRSLSYKSDKETHPAGLLMPAGCV